MNLLVLLKEVASCCLTFILHNRQCRHISVWFPLRNRWSARRRVHLVETGVQSRHDELTGQGHLGTLVT